MRNFLLLQIRRFILIGSVVALVGCSMGLDYVKPDTQLPQKWLSADDQSSSEPVQQDWWQNFHDPVLSQLIAKASQGNLDLQIAEARITEARAARSSAVASLLPTGNVMGSATREANQLAVPGSFPGITKPFNIFQTGFDASWELDLFGVNRKRLAAASADLEASQASRDDIMISLLAEVARTYIDIRQYQSQLAIAQNTIDADAKTSDIIKQRFEVGEDPRFDLTQANAQLEEEQTQLPTYRNMLAQAEFSMDVLLGEQPGSTQVFVSTAAPIPVSDKKLILAAPAAVIADRPDIRMAERKLAAATAQQGVAVAKFFPDISLSGFIGLLNTNAGNLFAASSESWMMGSSVIWPILSYGTLSANLDAANAEQQEAMATYRKTMINALSDVERSVTAYIEQEKSYQSFVETVDTNQNTYKIANQRYEEGQTSYLEVLNAQRALYASQKELAEAQAKTSQDLVSTYKSLGGGWKKQDTDKSTAP